MVKFYLFLYLNFLRVFPLGLKSILSEHHLDVIRFALDLNTFQEFCQYQSLQVMAITTARYVSAVLQYDFAW